MSYQNFYPLIKTKIVAEWSREWQGLNQKLKKVKMEVGPWKRVVNSVKREEVTVNRLRRRHSQMTHGYVIDDDEHDVPPICGGCQNATLSVKRVLLRCTAYEAGKRKYLRRQSGQSVRLGDILGDGMCAGKLMEFLRLSAIR